MAWDDAPPSADAGQSTSWDAAPPTKDELAGPSVTGFAKNAWKDVTGTVKGLGQLATGLATHPIDTSINVATHLPGALVNEGKRIGLGELATLHPVNAVKKLGGALYDKPLTTVLDVLPAAGAVGKALGIGGEAAKGVELASEAAQAGKVGSIADEAATAARSAAPVADDLARVAGEAPKPINLPPEAAQILKDAPQGAPAAAAGASESVPLGSTFHETVQNLTNKIPGVVKKPLEQVNDYLQGKFGKAAEKPGWKNVVADYMKEHGQNMTLKELGAAPGQVRKMGVDRAHDLADYALDNGLAGPKIGSIGREKLIPQRLEEAGGAVGAFRKMAADRGAVVNVDELINQVRSQLDDKYLQAGLHSGEKGTYMKALMELKKSGGRADELADKISELFKESKSLDRLKRPSGPVADVARAVREINHNQIASKLSPQEMNVYEKGLEDYGALTQINEFVKRRGSVEAGGRLGPGSGISRAAIQKFLDSVGYRTEAKIMRSLSDKIRANPEMASSPKNLFRNYVDEAAEAIDDMTEVGQ